MKMEDDVAKEIWSELVCLDNMFGDDPIADGELRYYEMLVSNLFSVVTDDGGEDSGTDFFARCIFETYLAIRDKYTEQYMGLDQQHYIMYMTGFNFLYHAHMLEYGVSCRLPWLDFFGHEDIQKRVDDSMKKAMAEWNGSHPERIHGQGDILTAIKVKLRAEVDEVLSNEYEEKPKFMTQKDAYGLREYINNAIERLVPEADILSRDDLQAIGYRAYIDHKANGYPESTCLMWARNYIATSQIADDCRNLEDKLDNGLQGTND